GSWIGGDQDGNPNVTHETAEYALDHARQTVLARYMQSLERLRRALSPSRKRVAVSQDLQARLDRYERDLEFHIDDRPDEPYRRFVSCMMFRLDSAISRPVDPQAYASAADLAADATLIRESLANKKGERLAVLLIDPLLRTIDTFGFHLYTLDVRQHAR